MTRPPIRLVVTDAGHPVTEESLRELGERHPGRYVFLGVALEPLTASGIFENVAVLPDGDTFGPAVAAWAHAQRADAVLPWADSDLAAISRHRDAFGGIRVVAPRAEIVWLAEDKQATAQRLSAAGVPVVASRHVRNVAQFRAALAELGQPLRLKPRLGSGSRGQWLVDDTAGSEGRARTPVLPVAAMCAAVEHWAGHGDVDLIAQPDLAGEDISADFVARDGRLLAIAMRSRTAAQHGLCVDGRVRTDLPDIERTVASVARDLDWTGVGNLQLLLVDGTAYAYEINARAAGSIAVDAHAGLDMLALAIDEALGAPIGVDLARPTNGVTFSRTWHTVYAADTTVREQGGNDGVQAL